MYTYSVVIAILGAHQFGTQLLICIYYLIGLVENWFRPPLFIQSVFCGRAKEISAAVNESLAGKSVLHFRSVDEPPAQRLHYDFPLCIYGKRFPI